MHGFFREPLTLFFLLFQSLSITDMGSGLGYLTFAVHSHFASLDLDRRRDSYVRTVGVESRAALVERTNDLAKRLVNTVILILCTLNFT